MLVTVKLYVYDYISSSLPSLGLLPQMSCGEPIGDQGLLPVANGANSSAPSCFAQLVGLDPGGEDSSLLEF